MLETESRVAVARGWEVGGEMGSYCLAGTEFQFCKTEGVWEMDGSEDCTTV